MNQSERRLFLIKSLINEQPKYKSIAVSTNEEDQKMLLRSLLNVRPPSPVSDEFLEVQNEYLQEENKKRGVVNLSDATEFEGGIYLWKGDITSLKVGAIVNAANSQMTGCYQPCHNCIDNCIHTFSGVQLRNYCNSLMEKQGFPEPTGKAKITPAFNLPCDWVIHTVGPIVYGALNDSLRNDLASCYSSCLSLADEYNVQSIAFCCISTGVFMFPNEEAATIAVKTVRDYKSATGSKIKVVFNVFKDLDEKIYLKLLN